MNRYLVTICTVLFSWQTLADSAIPDPEAWYREDYARLWADRPGEHMEAMLGWLSAELKQLKTDRVNATTTIFKASWTDHYAGAPDEASCGWYLADVIEGKWKFTAYADLDCASHGLQGAPR